MPSTRPVMWKSLAPAPAAARSLDCDDVARGEIAGEFGAGRLAVDEVAAGGSGAAAALALRRFRTALADDREPAVLEHAQLAEDAVAATVLAFPARAEPEPVALDAHRVLQLERLDRRRQRVRHRDVDAARPVRGGTCPLTAADRLVIREAVVAERDVVHRPLSLRRDQ